MSIDPFEFIKQHPPKNYSSSDVSQRFQNSQTSQNKYDNKGFHNSLVSRNVKNNGRKLTKHPDLQAKDLDFNSDDISSLEDQCRACLSTAVKSLNAAGSSTEGLRERLKRKKIYSDEVIDKVIDSLQKRGYLNDKEYAQSLTRTYLRKKMGESGVRRKLTLKSVPPEIIDEVIADAISRGLFEESAQLLADDLIITCRNVSRSTQISRISSAAQRKGHSISLLRSLIEKRLRESEE